MLFIAAHPERREGSPLSGFTKTLHFLELAVSPCAANYKTVLFLCYGAHSHQDGF